MVDNTAKLPFWGNNLFYYDLVYQAGLLSCRFLLTIFDTNPNGPTAFPFFILVTDSKL